MCFSGLIRVFKKSAQGKLPYLCCVCPLQLTAHAAIPWFRGIANPPRMILERTARAIRIDFFLPSSQRPSTSLVPAKNWVQRRVRAQPRCPVGRGSVSLLSRSVIQHRKYRAADFDQPKYRSFEKPTWNVITQKFLFENLTLHKYKNLLEIFLKSKPNEQRNDS